MRDCVEDGRQCCHGCLYAGAEVGDAGQGLPGQFLGVRVVCRRACEQRERLPRVQAGTWSHSPIFTDGDMPGTRLGSARASA